MKDQTNSLPDDLEEIAARLEEGCPQLSAMKLDGISTRVQSRARRPGLKKGNVMKSRLATILVLSTGLVLGGTGVSLGVTALQNTDNAATSEYGPSDSCGGANAPCSAVLGEHASGGPGSSSSAPSLVDQKASLSSGTLPFTGYLAVPAVILGMVFVIGGVMMRRFAMRDDLT